jgi:hypothetical protein
MASCLRGWIPVLGFAAVFAKRVPPLVAGPEVRIRQRLRPD